MLFGLQNAAQTFQRFMDEILHDLYFCFAYVDDILLASPNSEEHLQHLWWGGLFECMLSQKDKYLQGHWSSKAAL